MIYTFTIQAASVTVSMVCACIEHHHVQPRIPQNRQKGFSCMLVVRVLFQFVFPFGVWAILHFFGIQMFFFLDAVWKLHFHTEIIYFLECHNVIISTVYYVYVCGFCCFCLCCQWCVLFISMRSSIISRSVSFWSSS